jgi:hypothetical protein
MLKDLILLLAVVLVLALLQALERSAFPIP